MTSFNLRLSTVNGLKAEKRSTNCSWLGLTVKPGLTSFPYLNTLIPLLQTVVTRGTAYHALSQTSRSVVLIGFRLQCNLIGQCVDLWTISSFSQNITIHGLNSTKSYRVNVRSYPTNKCLRVINTQECQSSKDFSHVTCKAFRKDMRKNYPGYWLLHYKSKPLQSWCYI